MCYRVLGRLKNDDSYGDKKGKKAIGLFSKTITLHVHHAFLYIYLPSLHAYDVKLANFTFCGGREQNSTILFFFSWLLIESFSIQLPKNSPRFDEMNEME